MGDENVDGASVFTVHRLMRWSLASSAATLIACSRSSIRLASLPGMVTAPRPAARDEGSDSVRVRSML